MATGTSHITAEQYAAMPCPEGHPTELLHGNVVTMVPPRPRHGQLCARISHLLQNYLDEHPLGHVLTNDSGVITKRNPDTVRGADIAFYSFERVPPGPLPEDLLDIAPDVVFEVLSPNDRWSDVQEKVTEYLEVNVRAVCVVDDTTRSIHVFHASEPLQVFQRKDDLFLKEELGGFRVPLDSIFA